MILGKLDIPAMYVHIENGNKTTHWSRSFKYSISSNEKNCSSNSGFVSSTASIRPVLLPPDVPAHAGVADIPGQAGKGEILFGISWIGVLYKEREDAHVQDTLQYEA